MNPRATPCCFFIPPIVHNVSVDADSLAPGKVMYPFRTASDSLTPRTCWRMVEAYLTGRRYIFC